LNDGAGGFPDNRAPSVVWTWWHRQRDFNHDGNPDVVLVDEAAAAAIFLFVTHRTLQQPDYSLGLAQPMAVVVADLDNDGSRMRPYSATLKSI